MLVIRPMEEFKVPPGFGDKPDEWRFYLLCQVQCKGSPVYVKEITIRGDLPLRPGDCFTMHSMTGKTTDEIETWRKESKAYMQISWSALLSDGGAFELKDKEPRFLTFSLWHPMIKGQREYGYAGGLESYIGTINPPNKPALINGTASAAEVLNLHTADRHNYPLNENLLLESIKWEVHFNDRSIVIPKNKINNLRIVTDYEWQKFGPVELLKRGDFENKNKGTR